MYLPFFQLICKSRQGSRNRHVFLWVALGALLLLTGCGGTGPTPTQALVTPTVLAATNLPSPSTGSNSAAGTGADWTTYHRDNTRSGYLPDMPDPQQLAAAWNTQVDGAVY